MYIVCWIGPSGTYYAKSRVFLSVEEANDYLERSKKIDQAMGVGELNGPGEYKIFKIEEVK